MRIDLYRRFMLGFNIDMRVFFCCPFAVFVTRPFNFILVSYSLATYLTPLLVYCSQEHDTLI
jgi:hypothetical protein